MPFITKMKEAKIFSAYVNIERCLRTLRSSVVKLPPEEDLDEAPKIQMIPDNKNHEPQENQQQKILSTAEKQVIKKKEWLKNQLSNINRENQHSIIASVVTPLHKLPYEKQLELKYKKNKVILQKLYTILKTLNAKIVPDPNKLPCPLELVYPSPVIEGYRNKDEFCIFTGVDGNPKTVGFLVGSPVVFENAICVGPESLLVTRDSHKQVVKLFEKYIRQSPLSVCMNFKDGGHWRNLITRSNQHGDLMAAVIMHPQSMTKEDLCVEKVKLKEYFTTGEGQACNLKSLYFQACPHTRCSHDVAPYELLFGDTHIVEKVHGISYHISPGSFFQINTEAAAGLLDVIKELCNPKENTTVFDVCCGTGTSSFQLAKHVKRVIGVDVQPEAIRDAKLNATNNGITNATFMHGKAEIIIPQILPDMYVDNVVAVLNPGRDGLTFAVIRALRECKHLKKIIYVTCKADGTAFKNFIQLCKPATGSQNASLGEPFRPVIGVPVDLFPHTEHCELVMMFER